MNNRQLSWTRKYNNNHFILTSSAYFRQICPCLLWLRIIMNLWMWIFLVGTILVTTRIEGIFNPRPYPSNPSNNHGNYYNNSYEKFNKMPSKFDSSVKEFMNSQKNFNTLLEENCLKLMIWLATLIEFLLRFILWRLDLFLLSMISMSLSKHENFHWWVQGKNR